jgi:hypothetical protein
VFTLDAPNPPGTETYTDYPAGFNPPGESFVREIPAMFKLVEKAWKSYLWTGDQRYIEDEKLWKMYEKVVNEFVMLHDSDGNGIPEGKGNIFEGSATYNETDIHPYEAGDAIGSQYQAYLAFANFLTIKGLDPQSKAQFQKAETLKQHFNTEWSDVQDSDLYSCAITEDHQKYPFFNKETSWFMPMKLLTTAGPKTDAYLDYISVQLGDGINPSNPKKGSPENIEAYTYLPDTYFPYNRVQEAWKWMQYIIDQKDKPHVVKNQGLNGDYPEISFTLVSQVVEGLMGVEPDAASHRVSTIPGLPEEIGYLEIEKLQIGQHLIDIRQSKTQTQISNTSSEFPLLCVIRFYGDHPTFLINQESKKSKKGLLNGIEFSFIEIEVKPGGKVYAEI